jgi:hypothetical protein
LGCDRARFQNTLADPNWVIYNRSNIKSSTANFERIAGFLPIIERKKTICFNTYNIKGVLPPGAGLVI